MRFTPRRAARTGVIAENGIKYARQHNCNVVIADTAGRLAVDEAMMVRSRAIKAAEAFGNAVRVDAMTGQGMP